MAIDTLARLILGLFEKLPVTPLQSMQGWKTLNIDCAASHTLYH